MFLQFQFHVCEEGYQVVIVEGGKDQAEGDQHGLHLSHKGVCCKGGEDPVHGRQREEEKILSQGKINLILNL